MDTTHYISELSGHAMVFRNLFSGLTPELLQWRSAPDKWNLLEILCHLYDEEREDFRARLRSVLEDPEEPFDPIDPAGWVTSRRYSEKNVDTMLQAFLEERSVSLQWLNSLNEANWDNTHQHPRIGPMSAKFILANWVAHDLLHIRQIIKVRYDYLQYLSGENLAYAGDW